MNSTLREALYEIANEIINEFEKQEKRIEYLQDKLDEKQKKDKDFLIGLASLINERLDN